MTELLTAVPGAGAAVLALGVVLLGALVQGSVGFGLGLISIPVLALFMPDRLPQTIVVAVIPLGAFMLWQERDAVRLRPMLWLLAGRVAGVVPAVVLLAVVPVRALQGLFAIATLAAVASMAAGRLQVPVTWATQLGAGTLSGFMGTAAGIGGPPLALLYAKETGRTLRGTLAAILLFGNVASLTGYAVGGRLEVIDLLLGAVFVVPTLAGLGAGMAVRRFLHGARLRWAVLVVVGLSGLVLLVRAITG